MSHNCTLYFADVMCNKVAKAIECKNNFWLIVCLRQDVKKQLVLERKKKSRLFICVQLQSLYALIDIWITQRLKSSDKAKKYIKVRGDNILQILEDITNNEQCSSGIKLLKESEV